MPIQSLALFRALGLTILFSSLSAMGGVNVTNDDSPASLAKGLQRQLIKGTVTRHADGDTLTLQPNSGEKPITVRMVGIDTPELHLPAPGGNVSQGHWAETAKERLVALAPVGSRITLETWGAQSYGRFVGRVLDTRGRDVNLELVREGWAAAYVICGGASCAPGFFENQDVTDYMAACETAVAQGRGIFDPRDPLPEQPFEFRARIGEKEPHRPVADLRTGKLLAPDKYKRVPLCRRVFFETYEDAAKMGYFPDSKQ